MPFVWILGIFLCLINPADLFKVISSPLTVQAQPGQNVVLSCRVEPPFDLSKRSLEWKRGSDTVHVYRSQGDDQDSQDPKFKGRTFLIHQNLKDGIISLRLSNVTKEDEGNYTCSFPESEASPNITLVVVVSQENPETTNHPGSGLSSGIITCIVIGCVLFILGILAWKLHLCGRCVQRRRTEDPAVI